MCGIVGYVGQAPKAKEVLIDGLKALEYRGYDSAGVAIKGKNGFRIIKTRGKVKRLEEKLMQKKVAASTLGIAHTRWATHGIPNENNAHPHHQGSVMLVHNGIIENYQELRKELTEKGYVFASDTDSEVACALIDHFYAASGDKLYALCEAGKALKGSYAFGILFEDDLQTLYAMRKGSPLIVGVGDHAHYIASDIAAIVQATRNYIALGQDQIAILTEDAVNIYNFQRQAQPYRIETSHMDILSIQKGGYEHFMLKEIHEEPRVVKDTIHHYVQRDIDELVHNLPDLSSYTEIMIVACGSAMHAGMIAKSLIESLARIKVTVEISSEFCYKEPLLDKHAAVIFVSQSGETADTLSALHLVKEKGLDTIAIVNVEGSTLAREAKYTCLTLAGYEIAVASTKAYCAQVVLLALFALDLGYIHGRIQKAEANQVIQELLELPDMLMHLIADVQYERAAKLVSRYSNVFFIGRGLDYALSMEGSLKLKEISYIHAEAYAAGEMKHGTISLIERGTPVIALASDEHLYKKTISNIEEVKARGANVILICREDFAVAEDFYDYKIAIPKVNVLVQAIATVVPLQLLAYQTASLRGCEIDQPRNLAKSVTVE